MFVFVELSSHAMNKPDTGNTVYFKAACPHHQQHCVHQHQRQGWTRKLQVSGLPQTGCLGLAHRNPSHPPDNPIDIPARAGGDNRKPAQKSWTHRTARLRQNSRLANHRPTVPERQTTICAYLCKPVSKVRPGPSERPVNPPVPRADPGQRNVVVCCLSVRVCVCVCHQNNPTFTPPHQQVKYHHKDLAVIMTSGCGTTRGGGRVPSSLRV